MSASFYLKTFLVFTLLLVLYGAYLNLISISPFIISFILAYLLNPLAVYLCNKMHVHRTLAVFIILISFIVVATILLSIIMPLVYKQIFQFIQKLPVYRNFVLEVFIPKMLDRLSILPADIVLTFKETLSKQANQILNKLLELLNNLWDYMLSLLHFVADSLLVLFATFYLIKDWDAISNKMSSMIPRAYIEFYDNFLRDINNLLSLYLKSQLKICLLLASYYCIAFVILDLDFATLVSLFAGFSIIVPFIGPFISLMVSLLIAYLSKNTLIILPWVGLIHLLGYFLEAYFLVPKLIGNKLGLHPLAIIFMIVILGTNYGIKGVFLAIPITGFIKIILSYILVAYKNSEIYNKK